MANQKRCNAAESLSVLQAAIEHRLNWTVSKERKERIAHYRTCTDARCVKRRKVAEALKKALADSFRK